MTVISRINHGPTGKLRFVKRTINEAYSARILQQEFRTLICHDSVAAEEEFDWRDVPEVQEVTDAQGR